MQPILHLLTILAVVTGTIFSLIGLLGFIRLPNVYTRLHATGKISVFGVILLLAAAVLYTSLGWSKGLILMMFLLLAGPVVSHAVGSAAYRVGIPLEPAICDELDQKETEAHAHR